MGFTVEDGHLVKCWDTSIADHSWWLCWLNPKTCQNCQSVTFFETGHIFCVFSLKDRKYSMHFQQSIFNTLMSKYFKVIFKILSTASILLCILNTPAKVFLNIAVHWLIDWLTDWSSADCLSGCYQKVVGMMSRWSLITVRPSLGRRNSSQLLGRLLGTKLRPAAPGATLCEIWMKFGVGLPNNPPPISSVATVSYWLRSVGFGSVLSQKPRFRFRFGFLILSGRHRQQGLPTIPCRTFPHGSIPRCSVLHRTFQRRRRGARRRWRWNVWFVSSVITRPLKSFSKAACRCSKPCRVGTPSRPMD